MSDTKTPAPSASATVPSSSVPVPKSSGKKATPPATRPTTATPVVTWELVTEKANGVTHDSSIFSRDIKNDADDKDGKAIMSRIRECIENHQDDKKASGFGDQETIWTSAKDGTKSVDYQGTRAGGDTFFIDIQGQRGIGKKRQTYWQIMVQTCMGCLPTRT